MESQGLQDQLNRQSRAKEFLTFLFGAIFAVIEVVGAVRNPKEFQA